MTPIGPARSRTLKRRATTNIDGQLSLVGPRAQLLPIATRRLAGVPRLCRPRATGRVDASVIDILTRGSVDRESATADGLDGEPEASIRSRR
jgi:hypothetical protein